ncbi:hypothetical protein FAES_1850 [Fibrella aestuarina BUZ 2]|uniref:Uncharacterized protein n=2 Tax=Fibrella TaxID=861914 RepID=I0K6V7_9BACT|nr:hypothetical protein FAES_1850 [Fibrella aestuarina BUZ 2]
MLGVIRVVITSNAKLKKNGDPYSQQPKTVDDPGVAVWFEHVRAKGHQFCLACDQYDTIAGNLNEIRLAVGELRGFTRRMLLPVGEALKPFGAVPTNVSSPAPTPKQPAKPATITPYWQRVLGVDTIGADRLTWKHCLTAYQAKLRQELTQQQRDALVAAQTEAAMHFGQDI